MKPIYFHADAYEHFIGWQEQSPEIFEKIKVLIKDISRDAFKGLGKPEPLKHHYRGYWSRRITSEHRIIYKFEGSTITIVSMKGHYI